MEIYAKETFPIFSNARGIRWMINSEIYLILKRNINHHRRQPKVTHEVNEIDLKVVKHRKTVANSWIRRQLKWGIKLHWHNIKRKWAVAGTAKSSILFYIPSRTEMVLSKDLAGFLQGVPRIFIFLQGTRLGLSFSSEEFSADFFYFPAQNLQKIWWKIQLKPSETKPTSVRLFIL